MFLVNVASITNDNSGQIVEANAIALASSVVVIQVSPVFMSSSVRSASGARRA